MERYIKIGITQLSLVILSICLLGSVIATQVPLTTDQELQITDVAIIGTVDRHNTQIAVLFSTRQILPSPTQITLTPTPPPSWTPTQTRTLQGTASIPTPEEPIGLTRTPLTNVPPVPTSTRTRTPVATPSAASTSPSFLDPNYTCRIIANDNLTRRETPSPAAQSLGTVPSGTLLTIHPYDGSIPLNSSLWYVRIADISGGGWLLYARIDPNAGTLEPRVTESYMDAVSELCIPALRRS